MKPSAGSSAALEGALWAARAQDWVDVQERTIRPALLAVADELGPWQGRTVLDIGCGAGNFAGLVGRRGAVVSGLDACPSFIQIARQRLPSGRFRIGDMERIPFPDNEFAVVAAFNSLPFASDPAAAVAEATRVMRRGGCLVAATWGPPAECDAIGYLLDLGGLLPAEPLDTSRPPAPFDPDTLCALLVDSGLDPSPWRVVPCPWEYPDQITALRGLLSTGPATRAIIHSGLTRVTDTIRESIAPYRRSDGSYRLNNACYYLTARLGTA